MEVNVAGTHSIALLEDVKIGDKAVIVLITLRRVGGMLNEGGDSILQFSNGVLKSGDLCGVLRGMSLDGEGQTVDELMQLGGRDVRVAIEGRKDGVGREWRDIGNGGSSGQGWDGVGRLSRHVNGIRGHEGCLDRGFLPVGCVIEAKRCEESVRREVEGVNWGVQFDNV